MSLENGVAITIGIMMIAVAIYYFFSKKPVSIYNQGNPPKMEELLNVKSYNHATAFLMLGYGLIFICEGIFIQDKMLCLIILVLTVMPGIVIVVIIYETLILKKYKI